MEMKTMNKNKTFLALLLVALLATVSLAAVAMSAEESSADYTREIGTGAGSYVINDGEGDLFINYNGYTSASETLEITFGAAYSGTFDYGVKYTEKVDGKDVTKYYVQDSITLANAGPGMKVVIDAKNNEMFVVNTDVAAETEAAITLTKGMIQIGNEAEAEEFTGTVKTASATFEAVDVCGTYVVLVDGKTYIQGGVWDKDVETTVIPSKLTLASGEATVVAEDEGETFEVGAGVEFVVAEGAILNIPANNMKYVSGTIAGSSLGHTGAITEWYLYGMTVGGKTLERNLVSEKMAELNNGAYTIRVDQFMQMTTSASEITISYLAVDPAFIDEAETKYKVEVKSSYVEKSATAASYFIWQAVATGAATGEFGIDLTTYATAAGVPIIVDTTSKYDLTDSVIFASTLLGNVKLISANFVGLNGDYPADLDYKVSQGVPVAVAGNNITMTTEGSDAAWSGFLFVTVEKTVGDVKTQYRYSVYIDVTDDGASAKAMFLNVVSTPAIGPTIAVNVLGELSVLGTVNVTGNYDATNHTTEDKLAIGGTAPELGYIGVYGKGIINYTSGVLDPLGGDKSQYLDADSVAQSALKAAFWYTTPNYINKYTSLTAALEQTGSDVIVYGDHFIASDDANKPGYPADADVEDLDNTKKVTIFQNTYIVIDDGNVVKSDDRTKLSIELGVIDVKLGKLMFKGLAEDEYTIQVLADVFSIDGEYGVYSDLYTAIDGSESGDVIFLRRDATISRSVDLKAGVDVMAENFMITVDEEVIFGINGTIDSCKAMIIFGTVNVNVTDKANAGEGEYLDAGSFALDGGVLNMNENFTFVEGIAVIDIFFEDGIAGYLTEADGTEIKEKSELNIATGKTVNLGTELKPGVIFVHDLLDPVKKTHEDFLEINVNGTFNTFVSVKSIKSVTSLGIGDAPISNGPGYFGGCMYGPIDMNIGSQGAYYFMAPECIMNMVVENGGTVLPSDKYGAVVILQKITVSEFNGQIANLNTSKVEAYLFFGVPDEGHNGGTDETAPAGNADWDSLPGMAYVYGNADDVKIYLFDDAERIDMKAVETVYTKKVVYNTVFVSLQNNSEKTFERYLTIYAGAEGVDLIDTTEPNYITIFAPTFEGYKFNTWVDKNQGGVEVNINEPDLFVGDKYKSLWANLTVATYVIVLPNADGIQEYTISGTDAFGEPFSQTVKPGESVTLNGGTYTVTFKTADGWNTDEVILQLNGAGTGKEITLEVPNSTGKYVITTSGEAVKETTGGDDDEGLGLIEILLIIIVIAIVVMAIILIVRLSRS